MKGFIEVTADGTQALVNVNLITNVRYDDSENGSAILHFAAPGYRNVNIGCHFLRVEESYEEVKRLISIASM